MLDPAKVAYKKSEKDFIDYCGDHYIESTKAGALLIVTVQIQFSSLKEKETLKTDIQGTYALMDVVAKINANFKGDKNTASIILKAKQMGGDPT